MTVTYFWQYLVYETDLFFRCVSDNNILVYPLIIYG